MASPYSSFEPGRVLSALREATENTRPALDAIGAVLESRAKVAFGEQKRGKEKWPARHVPNIAGIVSDLRQGKTPPARRFEPRPAGVDTGRLLADIGSRVTGKDTVEIGSRLPYAGLIQYGGKSVQPWPDSAKEMLRKLMDPAPYKTGARVSLSKRNAHEAVRQHEIALGHRDIGPWKPPTSKVAGGDFVTYADRLRWLLGDEIHEVETNVQARPFLGIDSDDRSAIFEIVKATFAGRIGTVSLQGHSAAIGAALVRKAG